MQKEQLLAKLKDHIAASSAVRLFSIQQSLANCMA